MAEEVEIVEGSESSLTLEDFSGDRVSFAPQRLISADMEKDVVLVSIGYDGYSGPFDVWLTAEHEALLLAWLQARAARREKAGATS